MSPGAGFAGALVLRGFNAYLDQSQFLRARQRYWKEVVRRHEPDSHPLPENQTPLETKFMVFAYVASQLFGVFEDDGDTGYLYLYQANEQEVLRHLHVYDRSAVLQVRAED